MQAVDVSQESKNIQDQISALKTYTETSSAIKNAERSAGNSLSQSIFDVSQQLNKISESQKRFQRNDLSSMDNLLNFIGLTSGSGPETLQYIRKKIVETAVKIEPQIQEIIAKETLRALGCSQEQTYDGFAVSANDLQITPLSQRPVQEGIYIPVQSIDFFGNLKKKVNSQFGKFFYEKQTPSTSGQFIPYGGLVKFPMNKTLKLLMDNNGSPAPSYAETYGRNYQGRSTQPLFDFQYTTNNGIVDGNFIRVMLINREDENGNKLNTVFNFISDYYSTLKLVDPVLIGAQIVDLFSGAVSISQNRTTAEITNQTAFGRIIQRILGLCFDSRQEIDVSGVSKIAELDGVDDKFFDLTDVDLRTIQVTISNIQQGVVQFEDCNNVKLTVQSQVVVDELIKFRDLLDENSDAENTEAINNIVNSVTQNEEWKRAINSGLAINVSVDKNVIKQIPLAVAAAVLTPKVLLPIYTLLAVVQNEASVTWNNAVSNTNPYINSANTFSSSAETVSSQASNVVTDGVDFLKKFRSFNIEVISQINGIFIKTLFEILKRDIVKLVSIIIKDINKSQRIKNKQIITRLVGIASIITQLVLTAEEARKCKSLLQSIKTLLDLIQNSNLINFNTRIPSPLLFLTPFLPGYSPERATINIFKLMQSYGLETGPLPGGFPNLMGLYTYATMKGSDEEETLNGKSDGIAIVPSVVGGPIKLFVK